MAFELKNYQQDCLNALSEYLKRVLEVGASSAFDNMKVKYRAVPDWEKSRDLPYVCLRVPTGGGKTLIAACAIGTVTRDFLQSERSVVLWLAPTGQIVDQTIKALKNPRHPYRQALDKDFGGAGVTVMDIQEALYVTRGTLDGTTTIIVSTIQALRVEDTANRKVYEQDGSLQHHFAEPYERLKELLKDAPDVEVYSLAHVLRSRRPIVIMDEAHNARTKESFTFLKRLDPCTIIEFTATPDREKYPSNVLYSVTASALKQEDMIKLPIRLVARPQWKEAVQAAVAKRGELEKIAKEERGLTGEYIRPIVLMQAQPRAAHGEPITVEVLRLSLVEDFKIPEEEIVRATGEDGPLPDDILSENSKINYVLTVQKLREGWDCPFAYVLCSASNLSSKVAVEQTLGRILRMPHARRKKNEALNHAYAFVTSEDFETTAQNLTDTLVENMGFSRFEARDAIEDTGEQGDFFTLGQDSGATEFSEWIAETPQLDSLPQELTAKVQYNTETSILTYMGQSMPHEERTQLQKAFVTPEAKKAVLRLQLRTWNSKVYPAALGETLSVPRLWVQGPSQPELFEDQHKGLPWKLGKRPILREAEWKPNAEMTREGIVDIGKTDRLTYTVGKIQYIKELREQLLLFEGRGPKTQQELISWLDGAIYNTWIRPVNKLQVMVDVVGHLLDERKLPLNDLLASRFTLRDKVEALIKQIQRLEENSNYQMLLLPDSPTPLVVNDYDPFIFPLDQYPAPGLYRGDITFERHYYEKPAEMNGEEARCAAEIDKHPDVQYWVRNLTRDGYAFWLPTATDKFYPDFVVRLTDGTAAVIEFKSFDGSTKDDSKEKKMIAEIWAERSDGKCRFAMVTEKDFMTEVPRVLGNQGTP